jgi:hypothetical protein
LRPLDSDRRREIEDDSESDLKAKAMGGKERRVKAYWKEADPTTKIAT